MATNLQRSGLGFEKFFKRRNPSAERPKESEKNAKISDDNGEISAKDGNESGVSKSGKLLSQKSSPEKKDESPDDSKITPILNESEIGSQKTDGSKNSSKKKKQRSSTEDSPSIQPDNRRENAEASKELVIKDDVGQVKLTEIINNSIKEAVLHIVKEGVCPLAESLESRAKDPAKKYPPSLEQETQDKENKPASPKHLSSFLSGANKTFDSHSFRKQLPRSGTSRSPYKLSEQERVTGNQYTRELCPCIGKDQKGKKLKPKDKSSRDVSPKIVRQAKGSSHFRTDNRRMTGNVNIYICSEANENAKDKQKQKEKIQSVEDSESITETKTSASSISASTSKLIAALRKKQHKNSEEQSLLCLCEKPEISTKEYQSISEISDDADDACPCDQKSVDADFSETPSSLSRDVCPCDDTKFSDLDFSAGSDVERDSDLGSFGRRCNNSEDYLSEDPSIRYTSYDTNEFWPCTSQECPSYEDNSRTSKFKPRAQDNIPKRDVEERCSCCPKPTVTCSQVAKHQSEKSYREPRTLREVQGQRFNRCACIIEEEDEDCCTDLKVPEEKNSICGRLSVERNVDKPDGMTVESNSGILKNTGIQSQSSKSEAKTPRTLQIASTESNQVLDKKDDSQVEEDVEEKPARPKSPKPTLLTTLKKNLGKKSGDQESKIGPQEPSKKVDQVLNSVTEKDRETIDTLQDDSKRDSPISDAKQKNSFFHRSIKKAMGMVKTRKDGNIEVAESVENKKNREYSPESQTNPKTNDNNVTSVEKDSNAIENDNSTKKSPLHQNRKKKAEKPISTSGNTLNPENRSRSRIGTAITTRRNSASTTNNSSNQSISPNLGEPSGSLTNLTPSQENKVPKDCRCNKLPENCDCQKSERTKDESLKYNTECKKVISSPTVCCKNVATQPCKCCNTCGNSMEKCICCSRKCEPIEDDVQKCCQRCRRQIDDCKCFSLKQNIINEDFCKFCHRPKRLCCCELQENSRISKFQPTKCRPADFQENHRQCQNCCHPKTECRCKQRLPAYKEREPKSMICIYCDNPQENCQCRAPVRKCSECALPMDICNCKISSCCDCNGRQIISPESSNDRTICVTAWKPRRNIRRYFARESDNADDNSDGNCACFEKAMPYGSERLPYQNRSVFSDVMSELQQKISGSVCCNVCRKVPCCCCTIETAPENEFERKCKPRLSPITERRNTRSSPERSRSKSPTDSCKCEISPRRKTGRNLTPSRICDRCKISPCRCRRNSVSPQKKPQAKCYYCKFSPCICTPVTEPINSRQFRKVDSSNRRRNDRSPKEERVNAEIKNEYNRYRGRESNRVVVPCPGSHQARKYCYSQNPSNYLSHPEERVR